MGIMQWTVDAEAVYGGVVYERHRLKDVVLSDNPSAADIVRAIGKSLDPADCIISVVSADEIAVQMQRDGGQDLERYWFSRCGPQLDSIIPFRSSPSPDNHAASVGSVEDGAHLQGRVKGGG